MSRTLPEIAQPYELTPEVAATQRALNQACQEMNESWAVYDAEVDSLQGIDLSEETTQRFAQTAHEVGQLGIGLLVKERALRLKIAAHMEQVQIAHVTARDARHQLFEEAKEDITKKLVKIGYSEEIAPGFARPSLTPGVVMAHPTVARHYAELIAITDYDGGQQRANADALSKIDAEIEKIRRELVSRVQV